MLWQQGIEHALLQQIGRLLDVWCKEAVFFVERHLVTQSGTGGFQTGGGGKKWKMTTKMPGEAIADLSNPYGEIGFSSMKWYHGTMIQRPEWIAVLHSVAEL